MSQFQRCMTDARASAASKPNDDSSLGANGAGATRAYRQGRGADHAAAGVRGPRGAWLDVNGHCFLRLGTAEVGTISPDHSGGRGQFTWRSLMPGARATPMHAISLDKAQGALLFAIEEWFEAAGHPLPPEWRPPALGACAIRGKEELK